VIFGLELKGKDISSSGCNTRRIESKPTISANFDSDVGSLDGGSGQESSDSGDATHFEIYVGNAILSKQVFVNAR